jgi:hypothetical protein
MFYISEYMKMLHTKQDSDTILTILQDIRNDIQQGIISHFIYLFFYIYIYYLVPKSPIYIFQHGYRVFIK